MIDWLVETVPKSEVSKIWREDVCGLIEKTTKREMREFLREVSYVTVKTVAKSEVSESGRV